MSNLKVFQNSIAIIGYFEADAGRIETWIEKENNCHINCYNTLF